MLLEDVADVQKSDHLAGCGGLIELIAVNLKMREFVPDALFLREGFRSVLIALLDKVEA